MTLGVTNELQKFLAVPYRIREYFRGDKYREIRDLWFVGANFFPCKNKVYRKLPCLLNLFAREIALFRPKHKLSLYENISVYDM